LAAINLVKIALIDGNPKKGRNNTDEMAICQPKMA
jgi:hypothetical protein